jgi:DNA (cytosine-5)-methyltransferase 1
MDDIKPKYTAIDLFSGAGGLTLGLKQAGFAVISAIEYEKTACDTYRMNHPEVALIDQDIRDVDPVAHMNSLGIKKGDLDLLAGCPPCQGFSTIGTRNRGAKENDNRNDYVFEMVRFAKVFLPKTIMMENVPALAADGRIKIVKAELRKLGYKSKVEVLNAADFGVPQRRRRMIMLCSREGRLSIPKAEYPLRVSTVRKMIGDMPLPGGSGDALHDMPEKRSERIKYLISLIPSDGGSRSALPEELELNCHKKSSGFKDVYGRMSWDKPSPTITGGCSNPSKGRFLHPEQNRTITLREAAMLQSFPRKYKFSTEGGKQGVAIMIGNALPPKFIKFHASNLVKHLALLDN